MFEQHLECYNGDAEFLRTIAQACFQQGMAPSKPPRLMCPLCPDDYDAILKTADSNDGQDGDDVTREAGAAFLDHVAAHYDKMYKHMLTSVPLLMNMYVLGTDQSKPRQPSFPDEPLAHERTQMGGGSGLTGITLVDDTESNIESNSWVTNTIGLLTYSSPGSQTA